jgi:NADPH:quinone reductase-like Zn-dependent oxidoreductase
MATTLRNRSTKEKEAIRDALLKEVWPLVAAGKIKPVVEARLALKDAQEAHALMAGSGHIGKILLVP